MRAWYKASAPACEPDDFAGLTESVKEVTWSEFGTAIIENV
jgi:hypothetical protein